MSKFLGEAGVDVLIEEIKKRGNSGQISSLSDDLDAYIRKLYANFAQYQFPDNNTLGPTSGCCIDWRVESSRFLNLIRDYLVAQIKYCGVEPFEEDGVCLPNIFDDLATNTLEWKYFKDSNVDQLIQNVHGCIDNYYRSGLYGYLGSVRYFTDDPSNTSQGTGRINVKYSDLI